MEEPPGDRDSELDQSGPTPGSPLADDGYDSQEEFPAGSPRRRPYALHMPRVGRRLYVSGLTGVSTPEIFGRLRITHVLNVAADDDELRRVAFPDGVRVRAVALQDTEREALDRHLPELVRHAHRVVSRGGRLVVSCLAGVSRSVSVCLAYKVAHEGQSLRRAWEEVRAARPAALPNLGFWGHLVRWERAVRGETSVRLLPLVSGMTPDLPAYRRYAEVRTALVHMDDLVVMFSLHLVWLVFEVVRLLWAR